MTYLMKLVKVQISNNVKQRITELKNLPEEYQQAYDELLNMYTKSLEYNRLATNLDGTLESLTDRKKNYHQKYLVHMKKFK